MAAVHFLKVLLKLRRVLLQDMAVLSEEFPNNVLLVHPVFQSQTFQTFAQRVRDAHQTVDEKPLSEQFYTVYPELCEQMSTIKQAIAATSKAVDRTDHRTSQIEKNQVELMRNMDRLETRMEQLQNHIEREFNECKQLVLCTRALQREQIRDDVLDTVRNANAKIRENKRKRDEEPVLREKASRPRQPTPIFQISRNHDDVRILWKEWTKDSPCVDSMEEKYGASWRTGAEKKLYHRRKPIIDGIKKTIESYGRTEEEALCDATRCQDSLPFAKSLHNLGRLVKRNIELDDVPLGLYDTFKNPLPDA